MMKLKYLTTILLVTSVFFSCNEDEWLKEIPIDFYSPENSYRTAEQFNSGVITLYGLTRNYMITDNTWSNVTYQYLSDISYNAISSTHFLTSIQDALIPENENRHWSFWPKYYRIIFDANVILSRIDDEDVEFKSEAERKILKAEAMFFRAYMYRNLGIQYGGVPIILEEIVEPKRDFVRASREDVFKQCISDLEFAATNLPHVTELNDDGRLTKAAANHLLTELYIIVKDYDKAIAAASSIINDPNYALMTERFGTRKDLPGDVYYDLFVRDNQNRNSKGGLNTESIWVSQYEYNVDQGSPGNMSNGYAPYANPEYWRAKGDVDGEPLFFGHSSKYGGRSTGLTPSSEYLLFNIWENDSGDIRNSEYNIMYDIVADNPNSVYYGQKIIESGAMKNQPNIRNRQWNGGIIVKVAPINNYPEDAIDNPETGATNNTAKWSFTDTYYMRLAETYLLRAEAYLGKNDLLKAAEDINVVRARANAAPIASGDVDIDYILDERARELYWEEPRVLTLMRVGKWVERVKLHDPHHNGKYASHNLDDYHNLWPIPQSEIERNTEAVLEQNPGY